MTARQSVEQLMALETERSAGACTAKLIKIARRVPNALTTLSAFVNAIITGTPDYARRAPAGLGALSARNTMEHRQ